MLTQSNTTHKSVPLILSSVNTDEHEELYRRKGLPALFNEAGFDTWFISNQSRQGAMIDNLAHDARHLIYIRSPRYDMQLLDEVRKVLENSDSQKILIVLHCYGSHFSYHQRYPREFAHFRPEGDVAIAKQHRQTLVNAYDNSIYYTDHFLSQTIEYLRSLEKRLFGAALLCRSRRRYSRRRTGALLARLPYDHFLSALCRQSGMVFAGISTGIPGKSRSGPQTTNPHRPQPTPCFKAWPISLRSKRLHRSGYSLVSPTFDYRAPRRYLNDHNLAVPFPKTGLSDEDLENFRRHGIDLSY